MSIITYFCSMKIEKGVPIPEKGNKESKYPFNEMEVGDSAVIIEYTPENMRKINSILYYYTQKNKGKKFTQRQEGDKIRVWRIK